MCFLTASVCLISDLSDTAWVQITTEELSVDCLELTIMTAGFVLFI